MAITKHKPIARPTAAKPLAPEDVQPGDYVAVLDQEHEYPASLWYLDPPIGGDDVIRVRLRPVDPEPPLRVEEVCVPFVYAKTAAGDSRTIDLRSTRLARIDRKAAKRRWKAAKSTRRRKRGKEKRRRGGK